MVTGWPRVRGGARDCVRPGIDPRKRVYSGILTAFRVFERQRGPANHPR